MVRQLIQQGIFALHESLLHFTSGRELSCLTGLLAQLKSHDRVIALSPRAVHYAQRVVKKHAWPCRLNYLAIGPTTAQLFQRLCGQPVCYPDRDSTSEGLLALPLLCTVVGRQILLLRGNSGRAVLADTLSARGAQVIPCECYQRVTRGQQHPLPVGRWQHAAIDCILVTSGEILQQLYERVPRSAHGWLLQCRLVVISRRLAALASDLGWTKIEVAERPDNGALQHLFVDLDARKG